MTKWICHRCGTKTEQDTCPVCGETLAEQQAAAAYQPYILSPEMTTEDLARAVVTALVDFAFLEDIEAAVESPDCENYGPNERAEMQAVYYVMREAALMLRDRLGAVDAIHLSGQ